MKSLFIRLKKYFRSWYYLFRFLEWGNKHTSKTCINLRIGENHASRNIYFFVKALSTNGNKVYACTDRKFIKRMLKDYYASLILTEKLLNFRFKPLAGCRTLGISPDSNVKISYDYFSLLLSGRPIPPGHYHVPIGMHPLQYHLQLHEQTFAVSRKKMLFFSGNLKAKFYDNFDGRKVFDMPGRLDLIEALKASSVKLLLNVECDKLDTENLQGKAVICDTDCCKVAHEDWRKVLAGMHFFMCFPGQVIPFCHNIYEAMSVGTIPVLHRNYAALFTPPLQDGVDCFTFENEKHFVEICQGCLELPAEKLMPMHEAVNNYYQEHLSLEAVGKKIMDENLQVIYLQAEQYSLQMLKANGGLSKTG